MPVTIDTMNEIFAEVQNDMSLIIAQAKDDFYRPEIDRETVKMWLSLPLMLREAITEKNPSLAKKMDKKADEYRRGDDYGIPE